MRCFFLCNLCELCVSVVILVENIHHRGTKDTKAETDKNPVVVLTSWAVINRKPQRPELVTLSSVCYLRSINEKLMTTKVNASAGSAAGLRGVAAATSSISDVNGEKGELIYQGYNIHDLAEQSTFEEGVFLLWNKRLPTSSELAELEKSLRANYAVSADVIALIKQFPREADPIDVLRTAVSALEFYDADARNLSREASVKTAIKLTAQFPTLVAAADRIRRGLEPGTPH